MNSTNTDTTSVETTNSSTKKVYETGDHKNVANMEPLIATVQTIGALYNPAKELIRIDALEEVRILAQEKLAIAVTMHNTWTTRITERVDAFAGLYKYVTRIYNAYKLQEDDPEKIKDLYSIIRKLKGRRVKPVAENADETTDSTNHSVSQNSYDSRIFNFSKMLDMVRANPNYAPNEEDLKIPAITANLEALKASNTQVITATLSWKQARMERDEVLYAPKTGLVYRAKMVKVYADSILEKDHPLNVSLKKLRFKSK